MQRQWRRRPGPRLQRLGLGERLELPLEYLPKHGARRILRTKVLGFDIHDGSAPHLSHVVLGVEEDGAVVHVADVDLATQDRAANLVHAETALRSRARSPGCEPGQVLAGVVEVDADIETVLIVDGHTPLDRFAVGASVPPAVHHVGDVAAVQPLAHGVFREGVVPIVRLFGAHVRYVRPALRRVERAVHEVDVDRVVVDDVEVVARGDRHDRRVEGPTLGVVELRVPHERRGGALAQVGEDHAEVLLHRVVLDLDLLGEGLTLGRLLDALACAVVHPAVVEAAEVLTLHPPGRELRPPVGAAEVEEMHRAAFTTEKRVVLAHDAERLGLAGGQVDGAVNGMPERPHPAARQCPRAGVHKVVPLGPTVFRSTYSLFLGRCHHTPPSAVRQGAFRPPLR